MKRKLNPLLKIVLIILSLPFIFLLLLFLVLWLLNKSDKEKHEEFTPNEPPAATENINEEMENEPRVVRELTDGSLLMTDGTTVVPTSEEEITYWLEFEESFIEGCSQGDERWVPYCECGAKWMSNTLGTQYYQLLLEIGEENAEQSQQYEDAMNESIQKCWFFKQVAEDSELSEEQQ